ncbi:Ribulose bisphosphate carboxylase/oxygenase activase, chloroplastic [Dichanthelium oligosanthes]|uniref:Ribulose bisphosphate carboxylase/oxygenase activase, chloroplastic n=1 Tax=Dichanthelium oligosanthes TaxID=888268 RepID=A0A1E5VPG8_9POAL|nr:Ribulose bisphosphate carboxylase/oxygenase activase, chloroplastic [Dichanthelium oligosanthes]
MGWPGVRHFGRAAQDIVRGKGLADALFQAPLGSGTYVPVMNSHEHISQGLRHCRGSTAGRTNPRVPVVVTGNDFSTLYAPLIRDGRMEKFYWAPTRADCVGVCAGIFRADGVRHDDVARLVAAFPGQSIGTLQLSLKNFLSTVRIKYGSVFRGGLLAPPDVGVQNVGRKLVNSAEGLPVIQPPMVTLRKLEYGRMLVDEQENVKRVRLADKYLREAALGDTTNEGKIMTRIRNPGNVEVKVQRYKL